MFHVEMGGCHCIESSPVVTTTKTTKDTQASAMLEANQNVMADTKQQMQISQRLLYVTKIKLFIKSNFHYTRVPVILFQLPR